MMCYTAPLRVNEHIEKICLKFLRIGLMITAVGGSVTSGAGAAEQVALSAESLTRDRSYPIVAPE